MIEKDMID